LRNLIYIIIVVCLCGCGPEEVKVPSHILSHEKMVGVMTDVLILESIYNHNKHSKDSTVTSRDSYMNIFNQHNITDSVFNASLDFYTQHPLFLREVYADVITEISTLQADVTNDKKPDQSVKDSIEVKMKLLKAAEK